MITLEQYWRGYDKEFPPGPVITGNAGDLLRRVNSLISKIPLELVGKWVVTSGYRPPSVNRATHGAAVRSLHMIGRAIDLSDPDGVVDDWCLDNLKILEREGIWMEHPSATKGWTHWQSQPPRSGKRVFYP